MIFQSFKMALKAIAGNKMRSFLTILGVVIGVLAIVVLVSIGQGANSSVTASIEGMGTNLISATINARRTNPVTADGLNELAENEAIAYIAPLTNVSGTVKAGVNTYDDGTVQGTAPGYEHIRNWAVAEGRFLAQPDIDNRSFVAVIGAEAASEMYGTTHAVGETFTLSGYTMTVIGVLKANGESASGSNDNQILIPYTLAQRLSNSTGISSFYVSAASSDQVTQAQTAVEAYLEKSFEGYNTRSFGTQYSVYNQTEMLSTLSGHPFPDAGRHCGHFPAGGRHRHYEHHAGQRQRAYPGDRHSQGDRRSPGQHPDAVSDRSAGGQPDGRSAGTGALGGASQDSGAAP